MKWYCRHIGCVVCKQARRGLNGWQWVAGACVLGEEGGKAKTESDRVRRPKGLGYKVINVGSFAARPTHHLRKRCKIISEGLGRETASFDLSV